MRNTNTSVLYIVIFIAHVFMIGAWFQNSSYTYETKAYEPESVTIPTATPTPSVAQSKPSTVEEMIVDTFGEDGLKVAMCESSLNPKVKSNKSSAKGLFQIIDGTWKQFRCTGDPLNAEDNIECAKKIYKHTKSWNTSGGWQASYHCHQQN